MAVADAIIGHIADKGHALVVFAVEPAHAHAVGRLMINGILPGAIGVVIVPLDIDQREAFHLMSSPENQAPQPWQW